MNKLCESNFEFHFNSIICKSSMQTHVSFQERLMDNLWLVRRFQPEKNKIATVISIRILFITVKALRLLNFLSCHALHSSMSLQIDGKMIRNYGDSIDDRREISLQHRERFFTTNTWSDLSRGIFVYSGKLVGKSLRFSTFVAAVASRIGFSCRESL